MKQRKSWTEQLLQRLEQQQAAPLQPILELCGSRRVWIENHCGVRAYSLERICVAVRYGHIIIHGSGLRLRKMQGQMLVITGEIGSILVEKG